MDFNTDSLDQDFYEQEYRQVTVTGEYDPTQEMVLDRLKELGD